MKPLIIIVDCDNDSCVVFFTFLKQLELNFKCFSKVSDYLKHLEHNESLAPQPVAVKLGLTEPEEENISVLRKILAQQKLTTLPFFIVSTEFDSEAQCLHIGNKKYYSTALSYLQLGTLVNNLETKRKPQIQHMWQK